MNTVTPWTINAELHYKSCRKSIARISVTGFSLVIGLGLSACATATGRSGVAPPYDPSTALRTLFHDVQMAGVFADSKTFVDARPLLPPAAIVERYEAERVTPGFDIRASVNRHFEPPRPVVPEFKADTARSLEAHIRDAETYAAAMK